MPRLDRVGDGLDVQVGHVELAVHGGQRRRNGLRVHEHVCLVRAARVGGSGISAEQAPGLAINLVRGGELINDVCVDPLLTCDHTASAS